MTLFRSVALALAMSISVAAFAEDQKNTNAAGSAPARGYERDRDSDSPPLLTGPSLHLALGIRMKKAPDLDTYYSTVGGVKISAFSLQVGNQAYLSFLCPGLHYAGFGVFAPSLTPIIFNHNIGLGFGVDFFTVRDDRAGGPVGMSLNLDVVRLASAISSFAGR